MDIEGLKQALEAATPGPWRVAGPSGFVENSSSDVATICQFWSRYELDYDNWQANARLIVEAVNNLPKLLKVAEERDALQARCDELRDELYQLKLLICGGEGEPGGENMLTLRDADEIEDRLDAIRSVVDGGE